MGIHISNAKISPEVAYDRVHLLSLQITQDVFSNDELHPVYRLEMEYRMYGVHEGIRYYSPDPVKRIAIPDFLMLAIMKAQTGDMDLVHAMQGIENAVATVLQDMDGLQIIQDSVG